MMASSGVSSVVEVVPHPSPSSCLSRSAFLADNFEADAFLGERAAMLGGAVALDTLRDELGAYLKHLRSAMIELINADYADFVALSANLRGLDDTLIQARRQGDQQWMNNLREAKEAVMEYYDNLNNCLETRRRLRQRREEIENKRKMNDALDKIEWLLDEVMGEATAGNIASLDRLTLETNHLNFCKSLNNDDPQLMERSRDIEDRLELTVRQALLQAARDHDEVGVARALRLCASALESRGGIISAINMVRSAIIEPTIKLIMEEERKSSIKDFELVSHLKRLTSVFEENQKETEVRSLLKSSDEQSQWRTLLMTQALLPVMTSCLDASIFSPGDPEAFYFNYNTIVEHLIMPMESKLGDAEAIKNFRQSEAYTKLMGRWNLAVYFQIRLQEIAMPVEQAMLNVFVVNSQSTKSKGDSLNSYTFHLKASKTIVDALKQCWSDGIFMPSLTHRFFRLSLQIMSRFAKAVVEAPDMTVVEPNLHPSSTMADLKESEVKKIVAHSRSSSSLPSTNKQHLQPSSESYKEKVQHLIPLFLDLSVLTEEALPELFEQCVVKRLNSLLVNQEDMKILGSSWQEGSSTLNDQLPKLSSHIVSVLISQSLPVLRQVSDIPRLYRRTNREVPTASCAYLSAMLNPLVVFNEKYKSMCPRQTMQMWLTSTLVKVSDEYLSLVVEVLEAVQKMEESLRRLKRVRDNRSGKTKDDGNQVTSNNVSDDNKIRLQLFVDVKTFINRIENELEVDQEQLGSSVKELEKRVEEATNQLEDVKKELQLL